VQNAKRGVCEISSSSVQSVRVHVFASSHMRRAKACTRCKRARDDRVMLTKVPSDAIPFRGTSPPRIRQPPRQQSSGTCRTVHTVCRWLHCGTYICIGCRQQKPASDPPRGLLAGARLTNLWIYEFTQGWAPPLMGGEGKPVAAHCTPEQKQRNRLRPVRSYELRNSTRHWGCKPNVFSGTR